MANSEFYAGHGYNQQPPKQSYGPNFDAPLPPVPGASPFADHAYPYQHQQRDRSSERNQNPFADNTYGSRLPPQNYSPYDNNSRTDVYSDNIALKDQAPPANGLYGGQYNNQSLGQFSNSYDRPTPSRSNSKIEDNVPPAAAAKRPKWRRWPLVVWTLTLIQSCVFIAEIAKNAQLTGSPIMTKPSFNPMIGPSVYVLINMGARFVPCMRPVDNIEALTSINSWPCPNTTTSDLTSPSNMCTLSELCGFGAVAAPGTIPGSKATPLNQWWRFITPMFLHGGIIHIGFNMLLQLTLGKDMELEIGPIRFALVYFSSGIFGFALGGNYAPNGIASTGASGCLFGILALVLLDILYTWNSRPKPVRDLLFLLLEVVISFVLGLLPGLDNFSHIGGFLMGLVLGLCLLHSPEALRKRTGEVGPPYTPVTAHGFVETEGSHGSGFLKSPIGFFKGRKPLWWAWWLLRAGSLIAVIIGFILLLNNFYKYNVKCGWCKYLSCLPISNWCDQGNLHFQTTTTQNPARMLFL